jgi:hypothetical protein
VVWLIPHPRPWMIMPGVFLIPLLTAAFIIYPLAKESEAPPKPPPPPPGPLSSSRSPAGR